MPKDRAYELRVLYLGDPRLPTLDSAQRGELFGKVEHLLQSWFGYRATPREVGAKNLTDYFAANAAVFRKHAAIVQMQLSPTARTSAAGSARSFKARSRRTLRLAHPDNHPEACVHFPAIRLRYYDWHLAIRRNGPCRLVHSKLAHY